MRLYMTSALGKNDMKAIGLHMALDLIHQKRQRDMITGLMTKTEAGRPDWNQVGLEYEKYDRLFIAKDFFGIAMRRNYNKCCLLFK